MIKTLDRYIIKQFLLNFVILMTVLMCLFVLVDMIWDLDEFTQAASRHSARYGGFLPALLMILIDFYAPLILMIMVYFVGIVTVGAMGFTFSHLTRTRELVAMAFGGLSMYRIAAPVLIAGAVINLLALPNQEFLIPEMASKLMRRKQQLKSDVEVRPFAIRHALDGHGHLLSAAQFDRPSMTLTDVAVLIRDDRGRALARVAAPSATWDETGSRWVFPEGKASVRLIGDVLTNNPAAAKISDVDFASTLTPDVLVARRTNLYFSLLSFDSLYEFLGNPAVDRAQVLQIMHGRFSLLAVNILILAMGLPFFLLREEANPLVQGVKAAGLCLGCWGTALVMMQISGEGMNPVTIAWLPVVLYLPLTAGMLMTVRT
jgi:lipopolysaccharide export system permease protein